MAWNYMQVEMVPADLQARPMIGPGSLTRDEARAEVQTILDRLAARAPDLHQVADLWRTDEVKDDTVYAGPFTWTIYEHPEDQDPRVVAIEWLDDFADTMRQAGMQVTVAAPPN